MAALNGTLDTSQDMKGNAGDSRLALPQSPYLATTGKNYHYPLGFAQDFFAKECWAHHPKPYAEFMEWRRKEDERWEMERGRLVPGM